MPMILIRHGESAAVQHPELWRIPSNAAIGLSTEGVHQSVRLAATLDKLLESLPYDLVHTTSIYVSEMARAQQTLNICRSLLKSKVLAPLRQNWPAPPLNEFLSWTTTERMDNPYLTYPYSDPYTLWLADKNPPNPNIRTWEDMRTDIRSVLRFMPSASDPARLSIVFAHHYSINAILAETAPYSNQEGERYVKAAIRNIAIPNAVPILLGFPQGTTFPNCLIGESLVDESQLNQFNTVSA